MSGVGGIGQSGPIRTAGEPVPEDLPPRQARNDGRTPPPQSLQTMVRLQALNDKDKNCIEMMSSDESRHNEIMLKYATRSSSPEE